MLACLYGLYALLRLHFVQEEENYFTLAEDEPESGQAACSTTATRRNENPVMGSPWAR